MHTSSNRKSFADADDIRRFRLTHALQSLENALRLLSRTPDEGIEITALERIRDDLAVLVRVARA
jgi:hypothetical protein